MSIRRTLSRVSVPALLWLTAVASNAAAATGVPDDFHVVEGFLAEAIVLPDSAVAQVSADGGKTYYVDLRSLPRTSGRLEAGTPITVVGYHGARADMIYAHVLKVRELPPPPPVERASVDLRVIEGKITAMTGDTLTLRTSSGTVAVHIAGMTARLIAGELVQVLGVLTGDDSFIAKVLIFRSPIWRDADARQRGAHR